MGVYQEQRCIGSGCCCWCDGVDYDGVGDNTDDDDDDNDDGHTMTRVECVARNADDKPFFYFTLYHTSRSMLRQFCCLLLCGCVVVIICAHMCVLQLTSHMFVLLLLLLLLI